ncbi:MAG: hypothetical protein WD468_12675 [Pirellulales bacterium]
MPATEKTWRDQLRMHVIFGISALVMLVGTIWMLAKDHNREWRKWQLADRSREAWTIQAQLAQAEVTSTSKRATLDAALQAAQSNKIDAALVGRFVKLVRDEDQRLAEAGIKQTAADFSDLEAVAKRLGEAEEGSLAAKRARVDVLGEMDDFVREAKRREDALVTKKKFKAADQTAAVSARGIAVGEGRSTAEMDEKIQEIAAIIAQLEADVAAAKTYRVDLEAVVRDIQSQEIDLTKQIAAIDTELKRLHDSLGQYSSTAGEWLNRGPVLDALYTGNIKLDQLWLPDMKINYNFSYVARYDRCINCHRSIDKTAPGSATEPAYPAIPPDQRNRVVELQTPATQPTATRAADGSEVTPSLMSVYGIMLAEQPQVPSQTGKDVTIQAVFPESLAAQAGLQMGDVIQEINGGSVYQREEVEHHLMELVTWGKPVALNIRRGLDQPYTSHPRLDLFVGPNSPHKKGEMGCTICHDGQGSATEFKWASHTPNTPQQAIAWSRDPNLGWFDNHHWIFPMTPARFIESNCLKCHHEVVELEPSERFPEPPAPKLVEGFQLVREYGCYGCHEINGYDGPTKRIGPDLRTEPNFDEVAAQILTDRGLSSDEKSLARSLIAHPDDAEARIQLAQAIRADAALATAARTNPPKDSPDAAKQQPRLTPATHALADGLKDVETPGRLRKVGPSLRHLDSKVDFKWVFDWIRRPADFRPTTRMPQFFGHFDHLSADAERPEFTILDADGKEKKITDREYTERFEAIEIRALSEFLLTNSQPYAYIDPPPGITEAPSADRGKWLLESRGCLACHSHKDFPGIASNQGPDLSRVAAKFNTDKGQRWLYSWLKAPNSYHARTVMPNLFLDPIAEKDPAGNPTGKVTDPAADIAVFLLGVPADWQPENVPSRELSSSDAQALEELTTIWLTPSFASKRLAEKYARNGIPADLAGTVKVDERELLEGVMTTANRTQQQLKYIARRSLSRYGCFGCHDIPGYENAKPIGTPLVGWGRKDPAQLAFENIEAFLNSHGIDGKGPLADTHPEHAAELEDEELSETEEGTGAADHDAEHTHLDPLTFPDSNAGFFLQSLFSHQRTGFLWQKLRMPRSFDYQATRNKRYDERLRMPKFPFNDSQREAVMTFVLGLTNEAPAERYIFKPSPRQNAIVQGRHVLDKFNCAGCHILDMERWDIAFPADWFGDATTVSDFPFLAPQVTPEQIKASLTPDERGLLHAQLHGMPALDETTGKPRLVDQDGVPIESDDTESEPYFEFVLYEHAVVAGELRRVGQEPLPIKAKRDGLGTAWGTAFPGLGGDLPKYLYPRVIAEEKKTNPAAVATEAWGWLPPPLHHEGEKVQTEWLHDFLMDPTAIRPAVVMRMPNFHMSSDEASKLVNYFAAMSNAEFPYEYNERRRGGYLAQREVAHPGVLNDGMKIFTDGNYCVKCHSLGDYEVKGSVRTLGPNLDQVYRRLRPDYIHRWVGNPQRILPYTGMPVNIPYDPTPPNFGGVSQALFPGPSTDQLNGVVDLLMNFDEYTRRQTSVKGLVKEPTTAPTDQPAAATPPSKPNSDQSAAQ